MPRIFAFVRQDLRTALSYRLNAFFSIGGLLATVVPVYFVAKALQPFMARSIQSEGGEYFAFVLLGMVGLRLAMAGVNSLPSTFWSAIRTGTLESMFVTPVRPATVVVGMMAYGLLWAAAEATVLFAVGLALGVRIVGAQVAMAVAILVLITLAYIPFGIFGAALVLLFRTTGPLLTGVVVGSAMLGGIYYPTHVIPSWIGHLAGVVPLTYGLRALRQLFLAGQPVSAVAGDLAVLASLGAILLAASWWAFAAALRHAKRTGSLNQY
jgi:ABC-2 type transport system permease protein